MVAFIIDPDATCPDNGDFVEFIDCNNDIILASPTHDFLDQEEMMFITDKTIDATNKISNQAILILKGKNGTALSQGFTISHPAGTQNPNGTNDIVPNIIVPHYNATFL